MKRHVTLLLAIYTVGSGCVSTQTHSEAARDRALSIAFAVNLWEHIGGADSVRFSSMSEQGNPLYHHYQIMHYLLGRSPRSRLYNENTKLIEQALEDGARGVRVYVSGAVTDQLAIDCTRNWDERDVVRHSIPHAVFGPVYRIDELGEVITTIRFIVEDSSYIAYQWIAIHRVDEEGNWRIIEIGNVTYYKWRTVYLDEAYRVPEARN